jgi:hypothetical protein
MLPILDEGFVRLNVVKAICNTHDYCPKEPSRDVSRHDVEIDFRGNSQLYSVNEIIGVVPQVDQAPLNFLLHYGVVPSCRGGAEIFVKCPAE